MKKSVSRGRKAAMAAKYAELDRSPYPTMGRGIDISELVALSRVDPVEYVRAGFALVPIPTGLKGPRTQGWSREENAVRSEEAAAKLWDQNVGLAHRWSGTCAIDVDDVQQVSEWLAAKGIDLKALLKAGDAVRITSGRPNRAKLLYRLPSGVSWLPTVLNPEGVALELRCANADGTTTVQDVLPPSVHPETGKPYKWAGAGDWRALPELPPDVLALWRTLRGDGPPTRPASPASSGGGVFEGGRNTHLTSLAGAMRRRNMGRTAIELALLAENAEKCQPPLPEPEVRRIAASVASYEPAPSSEQPGPWAEPQPLDRELACSEPYPLEALPGLIGEAVREYQAYGQQPISLVASSALAVVSLAAQGLADVARDKQLSSPISLNFLIVAQSGERKTAADRALGASVSEWEFDQAAKLADEVKRSRAEFDAWTAEQDGLKTAIKSAARSKPQNVDELRRRLTEHALKKPREVVVPRLRYEDVNAQSLAYMLASGHPSAALWSDEGALVTGSHGMGKDALLGFLAMLNRLWDGGAIHHDRKQAMSVHVQGRRFTVSLMVQPTVLRELVSRSGGLPRGSGFLARVLITAPQSTMGTRFYREPSGGVPHRAAFGQRIRQLLDTPLPVDEHGRLCPPRLSLSGEAFSSWRDYHDEIERQLVPLGDYATACDFAAKSAENAARIAACLHIFEGATGQISQDNMRRAVTLARWYLREALRVLDVLDEPQEWADARQLDEWLASRGDCAIRDILRLGPNALRDKARRTAAIKVLEGLGRARLEKREGREMLVRNPAIMVRAPAIPATPATVVEQPAGVVADIDVADVANVADEDGAASTLRPSGKRRKY